MNSGFLRPRHRCQICQLEVFVDRRGKAAVHTFDGSNPCQGQGLRGVQFGNNLDPVAGAFEFEPGEETLHSQAT